MKKRVSVILLTLSMFCLASCGISEAPNNIVSTPKPTATTPAVKEEFATTETTPEPTHNLTAAELFATVLRDEKSIYFSELGYNRQTELPPSKTGTISELQFGYENHYNIANFAVVDLDGNRIPEVILEVEEYFGYIILSCQDGRITGNGMYYRGFCDLKKDGLYFSTSGAAYGQINRLYFMGDTWESDVLAEHNDMQYFAKDIITDERAWKKAYEEFDNKESAEWYAFTPENIDIYVLKNKELAIKYADLPKELKNRQEYLDSLSYLQELTYDLYQKSEEEYKEAVKSYFEHCEGEMEKILYQCIDKEGPGAGLEKEQQIWQENFDKRLKETLSIHKCNSIEELLNSDFGFLYWEYGDMMLRRTLRLLDRYYECGEYRVLPTKNVEEGHTFREVKETITAKNATNLRNMPSQGEDSKVMVTLKNGQTATRIGISDTGWSKVEYEGVIYYAVSSYLTTDLTKPTPEPTPTPEPVDDGIKTVFTPCEEMVSPKIEVNLRALPSVTHPDAVVVVKLPYGAVVKRTGINTDVGWSRVEYEGQTLYCVSSYVYVVE
ncbi:MAG: SH3 domain-containing protein [Lachnospiraceae bacterium]|nr:SH3 domain-containing protein [Lachnospiraceae bacterium]MBR6666606.1 SH3 domain-containing protein [Lachnospiraceae bacterium]